MIQQQKKTTQPTMDIKFRDDILSVNLVWLRDNCRCPRCYNHTTYQRKSDIIDMENTVVKEHSQMENDLFVTCISDETLKKYGGGILFTIILFWLSGIGKICLRNIEIMQNFWTVGTMSVVLSLGTMIGIGNDGHSSEYSINWINDQIRLESELECLLWNGNEIEKRISIVDKNNIETEKGQTLVVQSLLQYGLAIVTGVKPTLDDTEDIITRIGPVMHTIYGGMWEVSTEHLTSYFDTAYTQETITAHTDNAYFYDSPGVQVFHCFKPADSGGETILVDGFKAASLLKEENVDHYNCLTSVPIQWNYISNHKRYYTMKPVLNLNTLSGKLEQVRYNIYDRGPKVPICSADGLNTFYKSLHHFGNIIKHSSMEYRANLVPGNVIFINNWRVLHGRSEFKGKRILGGCYIEMGALLSKARLMKLIV